MIHYTFLPPNVNLGLVVVPSWCRALSNDEIEVLIHGIERDLDEGTSSNAERSTDVLVNLYAEHWRRERAAKVRAKVRGTATRP